MELIRPKFSVNLKSKRNVYVLVCLYSVQLYRDYIIKENIFVLVETFIL